METLYLKRDEDRRVKRGHPWVFSNEIDVARTPIKSLTPGAHVRVEDARGQLIGLGHVSPASLIAVRILARRREQGEPTLDGLIRDRLRRALAHRERSFDAPFYRLAYGEGDGLPGLIVDRFNDACVVQTTTHGMEASLPEIEAALDDLLAPRTLVIKNDASARAAEGLPEYVDVVKGGPRVTVREGGCEFEIDLEGGQKTGWFFDQRDNRAHLLRRYSGASVLDLYSYVGAWGVIAARAGARRVTCIDGSAPAVEAVTRNAQANGVDGRLSAVRADVSDYLESTDELFDVVVLDPPALVKRRKDLKAGRSHYRHVNSAALARVADGGVLVTCSCSSQVDAGTLLSDVRAAARHVRRDIAVIGRGSMPADHPIHPSIPEMEYLKCFFLRVE